jgi:hypothetical protein
MRETVDPEKRQRLVAMRLYGLNMNNIISLRREGELIDER